MSNYNPVPPRVWSRVQNPCTFIVPGDTYQTAYIPLTGQTVPLGQANYEMQMLNKGNVLQYKGNSARLTKSQKYSQLARCAGPNRTKVFATQTQTYTNPNMTGLLRVGYTSYPYPNQIVGTPNNISGPFITGVQNPFNCSTNTIQDGGTLVCGTYANPCTGQIIQNNNGSATVCNPASASNVPGSTVLCWNNKLDSWFPKQRYFMNNSTSKWPQGYKGFQSAVTPNAPVLYIVSQTDTTVTLAWQVSSTNCIPISSYNIYQNEELIQSVPYTTNTVTLNEICISYYYVTSVSINIESTPSNIVEAGLPLPSPTNLTGTPNCGVVTLNWDFATGDCVSEITNYLIYYSDGTFIKSVSSFVNSTIINNLHYNTNYSFYVVSSNGYLYSSESNTVSVTTLPLNTPALSVDSYTSKSPIVVKLILEPGNGCTTTHYKYNLYVSVNSGTPSVIPIDGSGNVQQYYPLNLNYGNTYNIYITYVANNGDESQQSNIVTIDTNFNAPLTFTATGTSPFTGILNWTIANPGLVTSYSITGSVTATVTTQNYLLTLLTPNTDLSYNIVANYGDFQSSSVNTTLTTYQYINITYTQPGYSFLTNVLSNSGHGTFYYLFSAGGGTGASGPSYGNLASSPDLGILYNFSMNYDLSFNYYIVAGGGAGHRNGNYEGGGAGGLISGTSLNSLVTGNTYTVSVGGWGGNGSGQDSNGGASSIGIGTNGQYFPTPGYIYRVTGGTFGASGGASGGGNGTIVDGSNVTVSSNGNGGGNNTNGGNGHTITLPFNINIPGQSPANNLYLGGGGGGGGLIVQGTTETGYSGHGNGGNSTGADTSSATAPIGYIANYLSLYTGLFFGGGGGGGPNGGNGSTGMVLIYWTQ